MLKCSVKCAITTQFYVNAVYLRLRDQEFAWGIPAFILYAIALGEGLREGRESFVCLKKICCQSLMPLPIYFQNKAWGCGRVFITWLSFSFQLDTQPGILWLYISSLDWEIIINSSKSVGVSVLFPRSDHYLIYFLMHASMLFSEQPVWTIIRILNYILPPYNFSGMQF